MQLKWIIKFLPVMVLFVVWSCGFGGSKQSEKIDTTPEHDVIKQDVDGELAYKRHCIVCHQRDADGIPKMYPPLAKNKVVSGGKKELIDIVLNGMSGEIVVNGVKYNGVMASYRNLSDTEIASILNYLRSNFGNQGEKIMPEEVKALR